MLTPFAWTEVWVWNKDYRIFPNTLKAEYMYLVGKLGPLFLFQSSFEIITGTRFHKIVSCSLCIPSRTDRIFQLASDKLGDGWMCWQWRQVWLTVCLGVQVCLVCCQAGTAWFWSGQLSTQDKEKCKEGVAIKMQSKLCDSSWRWIFSFK